LTNKHKKNSEIVDDKPFTCKYCSQKYKYKQSLSKHVKYSCTKNKDEDLKELVRLLNNKLENQDKEIKDQNKQIEKLKGKLEINNSFNTTYSPFDLDLFNSTELSLLYQTIINRNKNETNIINKPVIANKKLENELNKAQQNLKLKELQKQENKSDIQTFNKEELEDMKNLLNSLKDNKKIIDKEFKEKENELADIDCNERFENKKQKLEEERNKEKYNIFKSDIKIYYKLIEEDNFSENFIPPLFEAKYFILKYLFINDYFMDENKTEPSEEIFELR
jgi:hypothetical protein